MPKAATIEDQVRKVIADLGEDDDFLEAVKEAIDISELVRNEIESNDQVKEALTSLVLKAVREYDPSENEDVTNAIHEHLDYEDLVKSAMEDDAIKAIFRQLVRKIIKEFSPEDEDSDGNSLSQRIAEVLLTDEKLSEYLEQNEEVQEAVRQRLIEIAKSTLEDLGDDDDVVDKVRDAVTVDDTMLQSVCAEPDIQEPLRARVKELVTSEIGDLEIDDDLRERVVQSLDLNGAITRILEDKGQFQAIIDEAAKQAITSWLERAARDPSLLQSALMSNHALQSRIDAAISDMLASPDGETFFNNLARRILKTEEAEDAILSRFADLMVARLGDVMLRSTAGIPPR